MLEGDEEKAFVLYMRYLDLLLTNHKKPGFDKHKQYINELLGGNASMKITIDKLELLAKNLEKRYEAAYPTKTEISDSHDFMNETVEMANANALPRPEIEADAFYKLLKDPAVSMLIIDCRPQEDYEQSRVKYHTMLNVPEEILVKGVTVSKIKDQLSDADTLHWTARAIKEHLVLLDYKSCEFESESPIWVLKDVLQNWDTDFEDKVPIQIVSGGYENFKLLYPMECDNPNYEPKPKSAQAPQVLEIQYPDLEYYDQMPPQPSTITTGPLVDRSKKLNAIKTYEDRKKQLEFIQSQKEKNIDQSLALEKELLKQEKQWLESNQEQGDELKRQELESEILQKENKIRELLEEVERLKNNEKLVSEVISEKDKAIMEERNKRRHLEEKERERKKMEEQQKQLAHERQRLQAEARKAQRQLMPVWDDDEALPPLHKLPVPDFDRNTKPMQIAERQRDFSPIGKAMVSRLI